MSGNDNDSHKDPPGNYPTMVYGDIKELPASVRYYTNHPSITTTTSSGKQTANTSTAVDYDEITTTEGGKAGIDDNEDNSRKANIKEKEAAVATRRNYGFCYNCLNSIGCGCLARMPYTWPRIYSFVIGIFVPLWALIALSVFCGYGLATMEGPNEIRANDAISANRAIADAMSDLGSNLTANVPRICHLLFLRNSTFTEIAQPVLKELVEDDHAHAMSVLTDYLEVAVSYEPDHPDLNVSDVAQEELYEYMLECGRDASPLLELISRELLYYAGLVGESGGHTLNWNQCIKRRPDQLSLLTNVAAIHPDVQKANFQEEWDRHREELYSQYFEEMLQDGTIAPYAAQTTAFVWAAENATGGGACQTNAYSSAWFWFTIETTVGYGNQSVNTREGKLLVYTAGFLCILAFAGILGSAGYVALTIVDVFFEEHNLRVPENVRETYGPIRECCLWGVTYYMWMLAIAAYTRSWKTARLGEEFSLADGYWFAYISTTTVGFGDIYLEPEVIVGEDLVVWPLLFLIGFVFLSAFLGKFAELLTNLVPGGFQQDDFRDRLLGNVSPPTLN